MNKPKIHSVLCILILLVFLSACNGFAAIPTIQLNPCTVGSIQAECGYLHVPEDRNNPNSRILDLKIVVVRAYGSYPELDPLFYISGGPGGAAASEDARYQQVPSSLSENHDRLFVDQRGTGGSISNTG